MSFASEQLFNGYIRTNMPRIASKVKVREIVPHLPCLTLSDREEIEAKREISGNFTAMQHLLECLHRRENWPEEFVSALTACEHHSIAAAMKAEYDGLKAPSAPKPPSPPSTVVMVTVHSPPPVSPSAPAGEEEAPTGPSSLPETPEAPGASESPVSLPRKGSFSEPGAQAAVPDPQEPSTPTPSADVTLLLPRAGAPAPQEPEENSEEPEELVGVAVGSGFRAADGAGCEVPPGTGSPARPESMETWRSAERSGSPSGCGDDSVDDPDSASVTMTPEKLPVQESDPPHPSGPAQVESSVQPAAARPDVPEPRPDVPEPRPGVPEPRPDVPEPRPARRRDEEDDDPCFSKPGVLLSVQPNMDQHATLPNAALSSPSFSGNNISLQISDPEPEGSGTHPQGSHGSPGDPPQENPSVSNDLASFAEWEEQEVLEHVGHVMEEPSIQNLASPAQGILGNAVRSPQDLRWDEKNEGWHEIVVQSPSSSSAPSPGGDGGHEPQILNGKPTPAMAHEQAPARQRPSAGKLTQNPEKEAFGVCLSSRTKYVMTAAGVAACAMFVVWRLKN